MLSGVHSGFIFRKVRDCDEFVGGGRELQQINAPLRREERLLVVRMEATLCEIAPCQERSVHDVFLLGHTEPYASTSAPLFFPPYSGSSKISLLWRSNHIPALHLNNRRVEDMAPWGVGGEERIWVK